MRRALFGRVRDQRASTLHHIRNRFEIDDRAAVGPEKLNVLFGFLDQHRGSDGCEFECPHARAIAIRAANKAQGDFGGGDRLAYERGRLYAVPETPGLGVAIPIAAVKADFQPGASERVDIRDAIGIGAAGENDSLSSSRRRSSEIRGSK